MVRADGSSFDDYVRFKVVITATALGATDLNLIAIDSNGGQTTHNMQIIVKESNVAPVLSTITDQTTNLSTPITLNFTVTDADNDPIALNESMFEAKIATVSFGGSGDNRTVTLTPAKVGTTTIYINASDGIADADPSLSFKLTVTK